MTTEKVKLRYESLSDYDGSSRVNRHFISTNIAGVALRSCIGCGKHRHPAGGRVFGRLRLWHCAACIAAKEQPK